MGYVSADKEGKTYTLGFGSRMRISDAMRAGITQALRAHCLELVCATYDFGLAKPVLFGSRLEAAATHADHLPTAMIAARADGREVVVLLFEGEEHYVASMGASFQTAAALNRFLTYSAWRLNGLAEFGYAEVEAALQTLYADDVECIAGVDLKLNVAEVHSYRVYPDAASRPQSLQDLIEISEQGALEELDAAVAGARFAAIMEAHPLPQAEASMADSAALSDEPVAAEAPQ